MLILRLEDVKIPDPDLDKAMEVISRDFQPHHASVLLCLLVPSSEITCLFGLLGCRCGTSRASVSHRPTHTVSSGSETLTTRS